MLYSENISVVPPWNLSVVPLWCAVYGKQVQQCGFMMCNKPLALFCRRPQGSRWHQAPFHPIGHHLLYFIDLIGSFWIFLSPHCSSSDCDHFKKHYGVVCCSITADCRNEDFSNVLLFLRLANFHRRAQLLFIVHIPGL